MTKSISNIVWTTVVVAGIATLIGCISFGGGSAAPEKEIVLTNENAISQFSLSGKELLKERQYRDAFDRFMVTKEYAEAEKALAILNLTGLYSAEGLKKLYYQLESKGYKFRPANEVLGEAVKEGLIGK